MGFGAPELVIVLAIILLAVGSARLPKLARSMGQSRKEFEEGLREEPDETRERR